ncbi:MAG: radical SAM protein [Bdellovibrionota bacterium]
MKILYTNSPLHFTHGHTFCQWDWQTLVLPTLAGITPDRHEIRLVDNMHSWWKSNRIVEEVRAFGPDVIGFSIIAARDLYNTLKYIKIVRQENPNAKLLAGGQGTAVFAEELLNEGVDVLVRHEAERTLPELLDAIEAGQTDFTNIQGLTFRQNGTTFKTPDRTWIKTLDESQMPRFDLMPRVKSKWFKGRYTGSIEMTRGCPFACNFCAISSFWDQSYRTKSTERILEEIRLLVKDGRSHIYLADDNFGMQKRRMTELFERILQEGLDVRFFAQIRTDTVVKNPEMIELAARGGLYGVLVGFDTYNPGTFHHVSKQGSVDLNFRCSEILRKNKIMIFGTHIYGLPDQKEPTEFNKTFWVGRQKSDLFRMPHFSLLPGTKLYDKLITPSEIADQGGNDDFRLYVRPEKERRRFMKWYRFYTLLHIFLPDEILKALFHPNPNVRVLKRMGYMSVFRHYLYRSLRRFNLVDI